MRTKVQIHKTSPPKELRSQPFIPFGVSVAPKEREATHSPNLFGHVDYYRMVDL